MVIRLLGLVVSPSGGRWWRWCWCRWDCFGWMKISPKVNSKWNLIRKYLIQYVCGYFLTYVLSLSVSLCRCEWVQRCVLAVYLEDIFFVDACVACVCSLFWKYIVCMGMRVMWRRSWENKSFLFTNSLTAVNIYFREVGKILYEFNGVGADVERLVDGKRSTIVSKCQGVFYQ